MRQGPTLRFGIVCDRAESLRVWEQDCLGELLAIPDLEFVAILSTDAPRPSNSFFLGSPRSLDSLAHAYASVPVFLCDHAHALGDLNLDFILSFSEREITPDLERFARQGVWRYRFSNQGRPLDPVYPGFWEVFSGDALHDVRLERVINGRTQILKEGVFKTLLTDYARHVDGLLSQCAPWAAAVARTLLASERLVASGEAGGAPARIKKASPAHAIALRTLELTRKIRWTFERLQKLFVYPKWNVGVIAGPFDNLISGKSPKAKVRWLPSPEWPHFIADPFVIDVDGEERLFVENYDFTTGIGHIASLPAERTWPDEELQPAIELPFHMSYPCLFKYHGQLYCVPETLHAGELALYRCVDFPDRWIKDRVILSGQLFVDPTVFKFEGLWWLFCTLHDDHSGGNTNLYAWSAETPLGPWAAHAANPIKSDVRSSRSAGMPVLIGKTLYRPSQDCSKRYGAAVRINRVLKLTPTEFSEETVSSINPDAQYPHGCHHVAALQNRVFVDGKRDCFSWRAAWFKLSRMRLTPWPTILSLPRRHATEELHRRRLVSVAPRLERRAAPKKIKSVEAVSEAGEQDAP